MHSNQTHRPDAGAGQRPLTVLGIETSCDESAAALVRAVPAGEGAPEAVILSNVVKSQVALHGRYGGVVPEIAARAHVEWTDRAIAAALEETGLRLREVDAVAATGGPGLIGGLLVGLATGRALAHAGGRPFLAVNHLEAHALTARLTDRLAYPYLLLLVSGGHSQFVLVGGLGRYRRLGGTIDDAAGEAFDKTAKLLGLGYPGGPAVEAAARGGDPARFPLPLPLGAPDSLDLSFSGLKTAVRLAAERIAPLTDQDVADVAAAFQATVATVLAEKLRRALRVFTAAHPQAEPVAVVAGGVAANRAIRFALARTVGAAGGRLVAPPPGLCTDNGAMVAFAAAERLLSGAVPDEPPRARARWPLDESAPPMLGAGRKGAKA